MQAGKISLRPPRMTDKTRLADLVNNRKIWNNVRDMLPHPYAESDAEFFIGTTFKEEPQKTFAIEYEGQLCGMTGLHPQEDVYRLSAELGYWIGEPYWGKGIASQAVALITQYGFDKLDLVRIYAGVFEYNTASMRVLEKNGFVKEGVLRKAIIKNGAIWDEHRFSKIL
ncbi:MAG: GNAT family protein [Saprospiraceae bacterium]|nr:GNAT family N-acetyltransferase [Lewinella sp.]